MELGGKDHLSDLLQLLHLEPGVLWGRLDVDILDPPVLASLLEPAAGSAHRGEG